MVKKYVFIKSVQRYDNFLGYAKEMFKELDSMEICLKKEFFHQFFFSKPRESISWHSFAVNNSAPVLFK